MAWDEVSRICSNIELAKKSKKINKRQRTSRIMSEVLGRLGCIFPCWDGKKGGKRGSGGGRDTRRRTKIRDPGQDQPTSTYEVRGTSVSGFMRVTCQGSICAMLRGAVAQL
jgi:hypothetical protein